MYLVNILFFIFISFSHDVLSQSTSFNTSVIPIRKDAQTSLHKISTSFREPQSDGEQYYLIDLDAPYTWKDCVVRHSDIPCGLEEGCRFPLSCDNKLCKEARSYITSPNYNCPSLNITAKYGCKICAVTPINHISKSCKLSQLTTDLVNLYSTNGRNPSPVVNRPFGSEFVLSCAPSSLLTSFPKGVRGVASFSWSNLAFSRQLSYLNIVEKFALCLPSSSSSSGVTFLGDGPFYFTSHPNLDLRSILSYTPMKRTSSKSLGYYIKFNRILVKGTPLPLPSLKTSSVKFSTLVPYSTLKSDIYKALVTSFSKATQNIPRVNSVEPFSLCVKDSSIGSVPKIDLETESGKIWTISGDNSMKRTGNGAACLAFIDGGSGMKDAIVIGTFQMENNFFFFDLVNQKLGFSSSLLNRGTSCNSFNFTEISK